MIARRNERIEPFRVMQLVERAQTLERAGCRVIHFEVGEPDADTCDLIVQAGHEALKAGNTRYTAAVGIPELRAAIAGHYTALGISVAPDNIVVTGGASGALTLLAALLLGPGDRLLMTDPCYPCNRNFLALVNAHAQLVATGPETAFQMTAALAADRWTSDTRGMLLASPANPTGTMLTPSVLEELLALTRDKDGCLIMDEIYQGLTYPDPGAADLPVSALAHGRQDDQLYVVNSFSKYFGMTGWRLGWIVAPPAAVGPLERLAQNLFISPSSIAQHAAVAAFSADAIAEHERRREAYRRRRDLLLAGLEALGITIPVRPQGAFYLYADISSVGMDSETFCNRLLEEYHVAVTPGTDFGRAAAARYVRFAYTTSDVHIEEGLARLASALRAWRK